MRYLFESKVEEREQGYTIRVPFNVWEVCKKRDTIQGDIVLNNKIIPCELQPIDQGKYEIVIQDETAVYVEEGSVQKVLLHINGSLIRMDENSPYSFANPVPFSVRHKKGRRYISPAKFKLKRNTTSFR